VLGKRKNKCSYLLNINIENVPDIMNSCFMSGLCLVKRTGHQREREREREREKEREREREREAWVFLRGPKTLV
jgi:hypothetical protein